MAFLNEKLKSHTQKNWYQSCVFFSSLEKTKETQALLKPGASESWLIIVNTFGICDSLNEFSLLDPFLKEIIVPLQNIQ